MTAKTVTIKEAQTHLAELLAWVAQGKEVIIAKGKAPLAKLVALAPSKGDETQAPRVFGEYRGQIWVSEDFDAPLPEEF